MADKPVLFSGPMVRAMLAGTKTQTRRAIKPRGHASLFDGSWADSYVLDPGNKEWRERELRIAVGDRLYVRETWSHTGTGIWTIADTWNARDGEVIYQADDAVPGAKYWPSIHMPRRYSRITLTVTDVRVERLQDISEADAQAEGCDDGGLCKPVFQRLWNSINGPGSWDANPWVAAYTFTVQMGNIDQLAQAA